MDVGYKLYELRRSLGLTQAELGRRVGVSEAAIRAYETGKRRPKQAHLERIADALGVMPEAIADYGDLSVSENYGWSRNELLYAVQNGIVNSKPGLIDIVNTPNISGKNIMLFAPKGGIGYDEAEKYIKNEDITKEANMKLLASAKAGDLTWDKDGVTIRRQVPVTLDVAEGGTVLLNGKTESTPTGTSGLARARASPLRTAP